MRRSGSESWGIETSVDRHGATMLYLRDAAGLNGPADYTVPQLSPPVPLRAALAPHASTAAAEQWAAWWDEHLDRLGARSARGRDLFGPLPAPPPEPGTDLRVLYEQVVDEANAWVRERMQEFAAHSTGPLARGRLRQPAETVARIERELGRPCAPFRLSVSVLPLARKWGRRLTGTAALVVSEALWLDPDAWDQFLDPVVRSLA
jgi:hypothetical protein